MCFLRTVLLLLLVAISLADSGKVRHRSGHRQAFKFMRSHGIGGSFGSRNASPSSLSSEDGGLWPSVFNVATKAVITVNATCGEGGREEFCRMSEGARGKCGVCDNFSQDPGKRHPIHYAIDGTNKWWQSPSLYYGQEFEFVTITIDLKQVYQVAYIIIKTANSPRPGSWILERSLDGTDYTAWQFFATSDKECLERYGLPTTRGKPHYSTDSEIICTTFYSRLTPMENGEIHISLVHGRPGANETSPELLEFTKARYVRIRLQGLRGSVEPLPRWLSQDIFRDKRLFYSIRDISVGGQCVCNGHAAHCRHNVASGHPECECAHHTCGSNCDRCCPLYNQRKWGAGSSRDARECQQCNCHGHAKSCYYDETVDRAGLSLDTHGKYRGGGICENCSSHTTGNNCERCIRGYYRPSGTFPDAEIPCLKCTCDPLGSTGICEVIDEIVVCECRPGYAGAQCSACAKGFRGYPNCEVCPCDPRGITAGNDCEGECVCKANVEGKFCDRCKMGFFGLKRWNVEGCYPCFCSGVTTLCEAAVLTPRTIETLDDWHICDISATTVEKATVDERNLLTVGNYEIQGVESYYWLAPEPYTGNKLEFYGSDFVFKEHWIVMRGDTSGRPTKGPNLIIVGANGIRIAHGDDLHTESSNMTFRIRLTEDNWYHIPSNVTDIIVGRDDYKSESVSRTEFLAVLTNIERLMLRAKFHTDQIEAALEQAILQIDGENQESRGTVEKCSCPSGYTGLSCEACEYGYVRIVTTNMTKPEQGFCVKCDCNGHSKTCDADTGQCQCEHNTMGENCDRCGPGFYGNPLVGTPNDCKKCACPLLEEENNFSPSCQLDSFSLSNDDDEPGYVCTQCPKGFTGDHCEICDDGFFGLPTQPEGSCRPCSCGGNPCDRITGQCLGCRGNTEGWRCERCKAGYFGDPTTASCQACLCDPIGSKSEVCNNVTGSCECKELFVGRTCDRCLDGYGNMTAMCLPCACNSVGSKSEICDSRTGLCDCQPGVEGFHCDACQHLHFGFSQRGCPMCNCNPRGSELATCDVKTGNCRCKPYYVGRTCDKCQTGYWESPTGCNKCQCDEDGSYSTGCDQNTGRCSCKPGVGGARCDRCLPGHFGFSSTGCRKCDDCDKPGHMCDPDTGRCICPQFSFGETCSNCMPNTWGHEPNKGCKPCACLEGSAKSQCDIKTGECTCRIGYDGPKCDRCAHGYYGYPKSRRCNCDVSGTDPDKGRCNSDNICQCNNDGVCPCKENVINQKCNKCKPGTFGLHFENPNGCTPCFCFGRSTVCEDARLTWDQIRTNSTRTLLVSDHVPHKEQFLAIRQDTIAGTYGNITVDHHEFRNWRSRRLPLYWQMHEVFRGDRILSYGGYIRFKADTFESNQPRKENFESHPLVKLKGNGLELHYRMLLPPLTGRHEVRLHESLWRKWPADQRVTREILMIVLQNITDIYIKATDSSSFRNLTLHEVTLDTAIEVKGNPPPLAKGVELCACPNEYNSTSCQNPSIGYFRDRPKSPTATITIDTIVGRAESCKCNGRSKVCDTETGRCLNCTSNTDGFHCEQCAQGFYGSPNQGCKPCPCPSPDQNFAVGCSANVCFCKPGYNGKKCDECGPGYYGNPRQKGGSCQPCNCNREGIRNDKCDSITGQCQCKLGITGRQCSQCEKPRHILESNACRPCDACAQRLLDHTDQMSSWLHYNTSHVQNGTVPPPWEKLDNLTEKYENLYDRYEKTEALIARTNLDEHDAKILKLRTKYETSRSGLLNLTGNGEDLLDKSERVLVEINELKTKLNGLIATLKNFGKSHVDTKEALHEATKLIDQISSQYAAMQKADGHNIVLKKCSEIRDFVNDIISKSLVGQVSLLKEKLATLNTHFQELAGILGKTQAKLSETQTKNRKNKERIEDLANQISIMKRDASDLSDVVKTNDELVRKTGEVLNATEANLFRLKHNSGLRPLLDQLKNKEMMISDNTKLLEEYVKKANDSAKRLNDKIQSYISQLQLSDKELDAVNASKAYSNIVNLIEEAGQIAGEAEESYNNALDVIEPKNRDSLFTNVSISEADSSRLHNRIEPLRKKHAEYTDRVMKLNLRINNLSNTLWDNGMKNRNQTTLIQQLKDNTTNSEDINKIIDEAINHSEKMKAIVRKTMDQNITSQYDLAKKFQKYLDLTSYEKIQELQEQIKVTKDLLRNIFDNNQTKMDVIKSYNEKYAGFYARGNNISAKLEMLKAKIQKSKEIADGIRVSLAGAECRRSYRLNDLRPGLITTLNITFQYNRIDEKTPSSLFYLANDVSQYMNLKIVNDTLIFIWKLAEKENQIRFDGLQNELYTVSITRVSNRVKMKLNETLMEEAGESDTQIFNISSSDLVYVGYIPGTNDSKGLPGCVHDIILNDKKIGFWNFHESNSDCTGCIRRTTSSTTYDVRFNGDGYSLIRKERQNKDASPAKIIISFWLKTFDENALLFLAPHQDKAYMALTLEDGHIRFEIRYKNNSLEPIVLKTKEKYNDGRKVEIKMGKAYEKNMDRASLTVRPTDRAIKGEEEKIQQDRAVPKSEILKVKQVNYYFGGIPPDFYLTCQGCSDKLHTHQSLLGDMSECTGTSYLLLYDTNKLQQHYGVQLRNGELEFRKAWFQGEGYLEIQPQNLQHQFSIAFVVRTSQNNAFLMQIENTAKWGITNGKIDVVLYGKKNISLVSNQAINDDEYHLIELLRTSKDYVLKVNNKRKRSPKMDPSPEKPGSFYIGGSPNFSGSRFDGEISDIIIDNQLIKFNAETIRRFSKVKIGRGIPNKPPSEADEIIPNENLRSRISPDNMKDMQNTEGCNRAMNYSLEPNAAKFGDLPDSFVKYFLKEAFWKEDFVLELEFRTFYKNGILLYAQSDKGHYNLIEVKEGKIQVHVAGKRKKTLTLSKKVDDGEWHQYVIQNKAMRRKRKLLLYLDGTKEKPKKIPQNRVSGDVYIGGIPRNIHPRLPKVLTAKLQPFRGCIRELKINDEPQGFVNHHQIGQCFPNIERGSYFRGDAYAVYNKFFKVTKHLEFNFEFRTTEHNGILLSVSTPQNSPALSLELQNGAVVMSVDMGNGVVSNVTNYLSEYALCNNRWHNVTALFSTELTVNVDGVSKSWVISEGGQMDEIEDPLYIGGLPDYAPGGTLKIRENFKGCIRNVKIGNTHADWTSMEELNNVSLNSCPVA